MLPVIRSKTRLPYADYEEKMICKRYEHGRKGLTHGDGGTAQKQKSHDDGMLFFSRASLHVGRSPGYYALGNLLRECKFLACYISIPTPPTETIRPFKNVRSISWWVV